MKRGSQRWSEATLTTADEANTIVGAGRADLVILDLPPPVHPEPPRTSNNDRTSAGNPRDQAATGIK